MLRLIQIIGTLFGIILLLLVGTMSYLRQSPSTAMWLAYVAVIDDYSSTLYRMWPDGSNAHRLTQLQGIPVSAQYSPDGEWILFGLSPQVNFYLYRMKADGSDLQRLTDSIFGYQPQYSPNGEWIVLSLFDGNGANIFRMKSDGGPFESLNETEEDAWFPKYSPNDRWIYYLTESDDTTSLYRIPSDGGQPQLMIDIGIRVISSALSPSANWLVFDAFDFDARQYDIYRIQTSGSNLQPITALKTISECEPSWSPDEEWIAFTAYSGRSADIYRIRPDGTEKEQLTHSAAAEFRPFWSPLIDLTWSAWKLTAIGLGLLLGLGSLSLWNRRKSP